MPVFLYVASVLPESVPNARLANARHVSWLTTTGRMLRMLDPCPRGPTPRTAPWLVLFFFFYA